MSLAELPYSSDSHLPIARNLTKRTTTYPQVVVELSQWGRVASPPMGGDVCTNANNYQPPRTPSQNAPFVPMGEGSLAANGW